MTGTITKNEAKHPCELTITIESEDIREMLEKNEHHWASISGTFSCKALSEEPMSFQRGKFYVESSNEKNLEFKSMVYEAKMECGDTDFFLKGMQVHHQDSYVSGDGTDTSSVGIVIKEGCCFRGSTVATGSVETKLADLAKELADVKLTGCDDDEALQVEWKAKFGYFLGGVLLDLSNLFSPNKFCPQSMVRKRRPLELHGVEPEVYNLTSNDGVPLVLTRYKCGTKGPLLFLHGLCVTSRIFSLDTVEKSMVEFFGEHGYDMWLLEMRFSIALPSHRKPTHLNDAAENDVPPAVDLVLKTTGSPDLEMYAHCIGSLTIHVTLFGGHVDKSKIRALIASQSGFCMISSSMNHTRANVRLEDVATSFGFAGLNAYTDNNDHPREKFMSAMGKLLSRSTLSKDNQCHSVVCHRITAMFGLMWEHRHLNELTHNTLTEWFGFGHAEFYRHLSVSCRKGRLTDIKGRDVYIPDFAARNRLESKAYRNAMRNLDIPILYYVGSLNNGWDVNSTKTELRAMQGSKP